MPIKAYAPILSLDYLPHNPLLEEIESEAEHAPLSRRLRFKSSASRISNQFSFLPRFTTRFSLGVVRVFGVRHLRADHLNARFRVPQQPLVVYVSKIGYYDLHLLEKALWCIWGIPT